MGVIRHHSFVDIRRLPAAPPMIGTTSSFRSHHSRHSVSTAKSVQNLGISGIYLQDKKDDGASEVMLPSAELENPDLSLTPRRRAESTVSACILRRHKEPNLPKGLVARPVSWIGGL